MVERYDGDAARVASELVEAANEAGGRDNITAVFVAGPEFRGRAGGATRPRIGTTRIRVPRGALFTGRAAFLIYGLLLGMLMWAAHEGTGMSMTAPTRVGRYEIVRRLGRSMTDVYLAIDTVENRKAALKLVKSSGDSVTKLVLEAERRGAAIQREMQALDPRVVEIYDFGDLDGYFFVAMQYVEGRNLAEVLQARAGRSTPYRAAVIALEICEQLAKFHSWQSTVVHGDIKPSNIHIGPNDTVRLLDFGIAKTLRADRDATAHNFGSPGYCSPERLTRSEVDQQSDLWAVGATLYEMLAGAPPYQAEDTRKLEA